MNKISIFGASLVFIGALLPQQLFAKAGAAWSRLPAGARSAGYAGGMSSMADGIQGSRLNPAALSNMQGMQMEASHSQWLQGVNQEQGGFGLGLGKSFGAALGFEWVDMGEVTRYQPALGGGFTPNGTWHPTAGAITLSLGGELLSKVDAGLAVRGWRQDLDSEGAIAGSGSGSIRFKPVPEASVVLALVDLGTALGGDPLPTTLRLGGAWQLKSGQRVAVEGASVLALSNGVEWSTAVEVPLGSAVNLRGGILLLPGNGGAFPTAGFSVAVSNWALDFAYRAAGELGSTLHAGITLLTH